MNRRNIYKFLLLCIFSMLAISKAYAQLNAEQVSPFVPSKWNKSLDVIESKLSARNWTTDKINNTVSVLTDLQRNGKECIHYTQSELDKIHQALPQSAGTQASLSGKEIELNDLHAECRLFIMHSQEVLAKVNTLKEHLIANEIFSKGTSLVENSQQVPALSVLSDQLDTSLILQKLGLPYFTQFTLLMIGLCALAGFFLGKWFAHYCARKKEALQKSSLSYALVAAFSLYPYLLAFSFIFSIFFAFIPGQVSSYIFIYVSLLAVNRAIFYPPFAATALVTLPEPIPQELNQRLFYLLTLSLAYYICGAFIHGQNFPVVVYELGMTLYISLLSMSVISIVWLALRFPQFRAFPLYVRRSLNMAITALLLLVLIAECYGYHYFAIFLIKNIAITFILLCLACIMQKLIFKLIHYLQTDSRIHYQVGVHPTQSLPEFYLLQVVLLIVVWGGFMAALLNVWVLSENYYSQMQHILVEGFSLSGLTFVPSRILLAMFIFVFLMLGMRTLQVYISRRSPYYVKEGRQVALASVVGYASFAVFLIIALMIAGVNFTGLAIIAGALSVGIGFGLQTIANNFISGLILLVDSPIRPGDHIQVGEIEGIVKRIRLRATHIYTSRHADVFIPNSELISKSVTNFAFNDRTWNINCSVGVEYGCDLSQVKEILLKVAEATPEVIQTDSQKPTVFLKKFLDSSIQFELWCLIKDVSKKNSVESDLYFGIYEAFKQNGINLPFPQQDVYIKEWPKPN